MANSELGSKHLCTECGAKFYDLGRLPPTCPKCETVVVATAKPRPSRARPSRAAKKPVPVEAKAVAADTAGKDKGDDKPDDKPAEKASDKPGEKASDEGDDESPAAADEPKGKA